MTGPEYCWLHCWYYRHDEKLTKIIGVDQMGYRQSSQEVAIAINGRSQTATAERPKMYLTFNQTKHLKLKCKTTLP